MTEAVSAVQIQMQMPGADLALQIAELDSIHEELQCMMKKCDGFINAFQKLKKIYEGEGA